ncbi:putative Pentatricopeptide repeat-containing protein [Melia azedarach]|uniref:Pentatricopeptide repeat-containing protein n=2 Tax=Melia azedarach TaxID=155640 RepID=A0ACC1XRQ9_MELAZ|nr:putative Pentatricopeptide repeat-containing protein [Melia azedarach]KAJ4714085.1 putative Pentatricopeptide repeat-containing protein [Melia azedarach]
MGKIPPALRSAISSNTLLKTPTTTQPEKSPRHFLNKKPSRKSKESVSPETQKIPAVFKSPELSEAKKIFNSLITGKQNHIDRPFHNSLLQSYASISTVDNSISLLRHMIHKNPSFVPDRSTYHILISQSCKEPDSNLSSVRNILNLMVTNGLEPNQGTTDIAVRSLCSVNRVDDAVELVKELSSKNSPPDVYTYNFLVKCLCKCRALSTVYSFVDELRNSFDIKPNLVTYTILIDNVCNTKNLREAMRLVSALSDSGFRPDCFVYNTIMKGYCNLSKGSEVIGVYKKMKEEGVEPDLVTYNTLIFGLSKSGRVGEAKKFLKIMVEAGHFPDAVTYTSLMNGMCREGDAMGAMALLEEMEARGCSPNACTYNTLLHGLCKSRLLEKGIELFGVMEEDGMKLETASYATFVRALCRVGQVAEAYEVFDYAVESKSLSDVAAYTTLESTLKWLKKAKEQGHAV